MKPVSILPEKVEWYKRPEFLRALPLVLLLVFALAIASGLFRGNGEPEKSRLLGKEPNAFGVPTLGDPLTQFSPSQLKGQIFVLNLFASWCEPCAAEHSAMLKLAKSGKVAVYGIAWKDEPGKAIAWINTRGNPYQLIGFDHEGRSTLPLALSGVPETFIFDAKGKVVFNYKSAIDEDMVDTVILPLIDRLRHGNAP